MAVIKKTRAQKIEEYKAKIKQLEAEDAGLTLDRTSPGMDQLLAAFDVVTKENKCSVFDVLKSVSRIKRTGAKIEPPTKKKRGSKTVEGEVKPAKPPRADQVKKS